MIGIFIRIFFFVTFPLFACHGLLLEITFFDVGQGHCTLVQFPEVGPILIDCGSTCAKTKIDDFKKETLDLIAEKILSSLQLSPEHRLTIIVSHADKDHICWIPGVIKLCESKIIQSYSGGLSEDFIKDVYLGCDEKVYHQTKIGTELITFLRKRIKLNFITQNGSTRNLTTISTSKNGDFGCVILPALQCDDKNKANDGSLIVKVSCGSVHCLLTGDATDKTINHIIGVNKAFLKASILQVSHHGAERKCNSMQFIELVQPDCVICSSGLTDGNHKNRHPRSTIARRFFSMLQVPESNSYQPYYTGKKTKNDDGIPDYSLLPFERAHFANNYALGTTSKNIFSTLVQRTVKLQTDGTLPIIKTSNTRSYTSAKECMFTSLIDEPFYRAFALKYLVTLNLASLGIDDTNSSDKRWVMKLLDLLSENAESLRKFYINNNMLSEDSTLLGLIKLYQRFYKTSNSFLFYIHENQFTKAQLERFKPLIEVKNVGLHLLS